MKIGLFFGSFNPIHIGHLIVAEHIVNFYSDKVWFIVSPQNPFKENKDLLNTEKRLMLVKAAIEDNMTFSVSDVEVDLPLPSYTINTLQHLKKIYSKDEFFLIMGSDNFLNVSNWKSSDAILSMYKIVVYERPGFLLNSKNLSSNIIIAQAPLINISATDIRKLISSKKCVRYLLPKNVESLINQNNYYH